MHLPAGTTVTLRHAEMLNPDGTIYTANLRGARQTDIYTKRTGDEEIYEPHFTYHGFRYVELTGACYRPWRYTPPYRPDAGDLSGRCQFVSSMSRLRRSREGSL